MKRLICLLLILISYTAGCYAQENSFTQYFLNTSAFNPGFTGLEDFVDLKAGMREGWNNFGVKDNNFYLSAYTAVSSSKRSARKTNSLRVSDPSIFDRLKTENGFRRKQGFGGMLANRQVGPYRSLTAHLNYAYHLPLSSKVNFSLGTKIGYANQQINFSGLEVRDKLNDAFYIQLLESQQGRQNSILLDFGTVLYSKSFLISLSTQNLVTPKLSGDPILENINLSRYTIYSAGNFPIGAHVSMSPAVKINYAQDYDLEWAASTRFRYKEMIIFGGSYDSNSKVSALLGFNSSNFQLNYSYDFYLSDLRSFNVSVHEVVVGFLLNNRFGIQPRFW